MKGIAFVLLFVTCTAAQAVTIGDYQQHAPGRSDGTLSIDGLQDFDGVLHVELFASDDHQIEFELTPTNTDSVRVDITDPYHYSQDTYLAVNVYIGDDHFSNLLMVRGDGHDVSSTKADDEATLFSRRPQAKNLRRITLKRDQSAVDTAATPPAEDGQAAQPIEINLNQDKLTASVDDNDNAPILTSMSISMDVVAPASSPYKTRAAETALPGQTGVSANTADTLTFTTVADLVAMLAPEGYELVSYPGDETVLDMQAKLDAFQPNALSQVSLSQIYGLTGGRAACIAINNQNKTLRVIPADKHSEINLKTTATVGELVRSLNARHNYDLVTLPGDARVHGIITTATVVDNYEQLHSVAQDNNFKILMNKKDRTVRVMGNL